ncbi:MAG: hypothetical protein ACLQNE_25145 [Thermoguttaceae bacterium]
MSRKLSILTIAAFSLFGLSLAGCGQNSPPKDASPPKALPAVAAGATNPAAAADPADKELIAKQKICPVSGQPLGSMGEPVKVVVKERTIFLCCDGCTKKLLADPDKYLAKLDEKN